MSVKVCENRCHWSYFLSYGEWLFAVRDNETTGGIAELEMQRERGERERQRRRQRGRDHRSLSPRSTKPGGDCLSPIIKFLSQFALPSLPNFFPFWENSLSPAPICLDLHIMNLFAVSLATGPLTKQPQTETRAEHRSRSSWHTASEHLLNNI